MTNHTEGAPSFAAFCEGGRLTALWASPFTPRVPETKSSPNPHSPALAQTRRENYLHHRGRSPDLRLAQQKVDMFRHDDISYYYEPMALASLF
jgi:hypothetical protein